MLLLNKEFSRLGLLLDESTHTVRDLSFEKREESESRIKANRKSFSHFSHTTVDTRLMLLLTLLTLLTLSRHSRHTLDTLLLMLLLSTTCPLPIALYVATTYHALLLSRIRYMLKEFYCCKAVIFFQSFLNFRHFYILALPPVITLS